VNFSIIIIGDFEGGLGVGVGGRGKVVRGGYAYFFKILKCLRVI
jgi:hypothetical protein